MSSDCPANGVPWATSNEGTGHPWPVLSGENAEYQVLASNPGAASADLAFMLNSASGFGLVPEQVWNYPDVPASPYGSDPSTASIGFTNGQPDGSATPLTWAQAQLLRLIAGMAAGRLIEQPSVVASRYAGGGPTAAPLSVTAPVTVNGGNVPLNLTRPSVTVDAASVPVSGTTTPGARVDVALTGTRPGGTAPETSITTVAADSSGAFSATLSLQPGTNSVEVASTSAAGTNEAIFTVTDLFVPGAVVLSAAPAPGGGSGPDRHLRPRAVGQRARRGAAVHRGGGRLQLHDRARARVEPAHRGRRVRD